MGFINYADLSYLNGWYPTERMQKKLNIFIAFRLIKLYTVYDDKVDTGVWSWTTYSYTAIYVYQN